ncbi:glycosyltransferase [Alkalihalobacterium chitinilyticum]|uniref:Glycosyltransferase n=1 Tax=Alkalihalobacterium chitinilyticum TaxID=2980103 RepID=A0ABT5VMX9_9BACI|nr:glycosyltransferase [Alkalihalobacterium chitinilyticum]MDE5415843.1 glycosyltransferase [Alkalihalobacterium chitinilyticum]
MNDCLILITNYYPFHKGEEYLETELPYLANGYSKIYVVSTMADNNMKQTRSVPSNVEVIKSGVSHSLIGKLKMVLFGSKRAFYSRKKHSLLGEDGNSSILKRAFSFYFECRSNYIYSVIKDKLKGEEFDKFKKITIYSYWFYVTARVAVKLKQVYFQKGKIYTISRAHGYDINEHVNPLNFLPERKFLLHSLDSVFPVSQNGVDFLKSKYPEYKDKVEVKRLGTKKQKAHIQNSNDKLNIVTCSVVRKLKRLDLLIEALAILREKNINFKWTHIGDGPEFENIKKIASEKLDENEYNFTGFIKNNEVLEWYKSNLTTVFVNISSSEGVPVSIMEAMSKSLPVIATDVGGTKEIVEPNVTGYLLKRDCTKYEIADSLIKINTLSKDEYQIMCKEAFYRWDEQCNAERLYSTFTKDLLIKS